MRREWPWGLVTGVTLAAATAAEPPPVPPAFTTDADRVEVLRSYPLGVLDRQAVFSHHGKAHRQVELPNGQQGWVYLVGQARTRATYEWPSGQAQTVTQTRAGAGVRAYTLIFDDGGTVIDVLYNESGRHDGLSALALQWGALKGGGGDSPR
ncbi:MAG: hypothetical protein GWO02_08185 [Gammaproteobacteria bacterium]|nr:hypothetical protein [Gammaproteobacteria bacterium]